MRATAGRPRGDRARPSPWISARRVPDGSAAARLPARALGGLLSGFGLGLGGDDPRPRGGSIVGRPPRKRARGSPGNDAHSILRFVEGVLQERYSCGDGRPKSKYGDDDFLGDELKCYFHFREDVLFQAEEAVLCSAFEMALTVMTQSDDAETCADLVDIDGSNDPKSVRSASAECPPRKSTGTATGGSSDGATKTALRIVDRVILIDRRERATRDRLRRAKMNNGFSTHSNNVTGRRKKYEHLLRPNEKGHTNKATRGMQSGALPETKSILEEKYPKQWEWLQRFRSRYVHVSQHEGMESEPRFSQRHVDENTCESSVMDEGFSSSGIPSAGVKEKQPGSNFVIVRRKTKAWDDISLSSDDEKNDEALGASHSITQGQNRTDGKPPMNNVALSQSEPKMAPATPASPSARTLSPRLKLDQEAHELRAALLDMPPGESSSTEVVRHMVDEIGILLGRYGELDGAAGISRCGDVLGGLDLTAADSTAEQSALAHRFPLNDSMVSSLAKAFLTDATGSLRAGAFLRSFVLPLVVEMNPVARALATGSNVEDQKGVKGKPAPRALTSLLTALARDRPMECTASVVVPSLALKKYMPSASSAAEDLFEPTRYQCELILRVLRGRDALSIPAINHLVEKVLPTNGETCGGMKWTENTMPILTTCLSRQPTLPEAAVATLADEVSRLLSPTSPQSTVKSMKLSTLFHALVTKYGSQLKSMGRVESLKNSATRLKTFMSKTILLSLKKLS